PEPADPARVALLLEPARLPLPRHEVVDLLHLHMAEPPELGCELGPPLLDRVGPDLRRHVHLVATPVEGRGERRLRASVHRRRVDDAAPGRDGRIHHLPRKPRVAVEGPPGAEADDRPEATLLHLARAYASASRAASTSASVT